MRDLKIFRWATHLVPGSLALFLTGTVFLSQNDFASLATGDIGEVAVLVLIALGAAYITGTILWAVGFLFFVDRITYVVGRIRQRIPGGKGGEHLDSKPAERSYRDLRLAVAADVLNALQKGNGKLVVPPPYGSYWHFRLDLFRAIESLPESLGARLRGEWEYLGMLQAILAAVLLGVVLTVASWIFPLSPADAAILTPTGGRGVPIAVMGLVASLLALTYDHRNRVFASNVVLASVLILNREPHRATPD